VFQKIQSKTKNEINKTKSHNRKTKPSNFKEKPPKATFVWLLCMLMDGIKGLLGG